ncbi:MAG TPA: flagellar hook-basal body complex protein FliE [Proteiniclasticum sp.]|nr:flagellar hook-basal body complex protein FliE [Proteiniclasticum sp.]
MTQFISSYSNILDRYNNLISQGGSATSKTDEKNMASLGLGESFGDMFTSQLDKLNTTQIKADELSMDFASGNTEDLHQVMISAEEARISMELAVTVRNKIVEAYKELSSMQL